MFSIPSSDHTGWKEAANWDLGGSADSKCVTNVGHKVQPPLGPLTGEASANWELLGRSPLLGEGGSRSETGVGRYNLPGSAPHPPQCAHWGTFPQGKASPRQIPIYRGGTWSHPPSISKTGYLGWDNPFGVQGAYRLLQKVHHTNAFRHRTCSGFIHIPTGCV